MSRGPGKIERAIEAAFTAQPSATFTVYELGPIAYPGLNGMEKRHQVSIRRAVEKVASRLWWVGLKSERPGGQLVYCNTLNVRSYTLGKLRAACVNNGLALDQIEAFLEEPRFDDPWRHRSEWDRMQPGGAWWYHVEMAKAQKTGKHQEVERLRAELHASVGRRMSDKYETG